MATELGAPALTIGPGSKGMGESCKRLPDRIARGAPHAAEHGMQLALESLHPVYGGDRTYVMTVAEALDVCDTVDAPNLGFAVEVYHYWWDSTMPQVLAERARGRILGYHLCD